MLVDMKTPGEEHEKGLALLRRIHGGHAGEALVAAQRDICPDFARMSIEWAMAGVMGRPHLDLKTRQLVVVAACTTLGHAGPQLHAHVQGAINVGATFDEVVETILQTLFYAGGAAVANALQIAKQALAELGLSPPLSEPDRP
jgi:4-carboxymuconolactone decarboxylase